MEGLTVPQRKVAARVHLADGQELAGVFYVPATGPDGAPGRLVDQLHRKSEQFLPFKGHETVLIQKSRIITIELGPADRDHEAPESEFGHQRKIETHLVERGLLTGRLTYLMPLDNVRLRDYLNSVSGFIAMYTEERLVLINPEYVVSMREVGKG